jgi:ABC-type branched-subunit amino acid transport system substrate-binding protein/outer membrane protein assembly factor BamD (BamD/ComL family)
MKSTLSTLLFLITFSTILFGQTLEENKRKYNNGKELYKQGKYDLALQEFRQVASPRANNPYFKYASYFYVASAMKANKFTDAKLMAAQIEHKYADWDKLGEVRLLLAEMAFKERDYQGGIEYLQKLDKKIDQKAVKGMAIHYLDNIGSIDSLKALNKKFPENQYVGEVLVKKIQLQNVSKENKEILRQLVGQFKIDTASFASTLKFPTEKKSAYNVALLFPFNLKDLNPENTSRANYYALDLYEGIKRGIENLAKQGVKINLYTYDAGKDNSAISAVISKESLKTMDLIIGPLSNAPIPAFDDFIISNKLLAVNPVGTHSTLIANNPFNYLNESTLELQSKKAAEFILQSFAPKKAAIYYGATTRDSTLAFNYHKTMVEKGVKILAFEKVTKANVNILTKVLSDSSKYDMGNVFISSSEQTVAANFVSEIEKNGYKIPIVGLPHWMQYSFFNLDQFARNNFYFIYPDFVDYTSPAVIDFRNNYRKTVNIIPSEFAYSGYDLINYFGNALWKYGTNFQKGISSAGFTPGITTAGYDYSNGNSNNFVPLVKFEGGDLKVINSPIK